MASSFAITLLSNAGTGNGGAVYFPGGKAAFIGSSTFGGGSVKLQVQCPDASGTWADVSGASLTAAGMVSSLELPPGQYRAVATTATANYYSLVRIPY